MGLNEKIELPIRVIKKGGFHRNCPGPPLCNLPNPRPHLKRGVTNPGAKNIDPGETDTTCVQKKGFEK